MPEINIDTDSLQTTDSIQVTSQQAPQTILFFADSTVVDSARLSAQTIQRPAYEAFPNIERPAKAAGDNLIFLIFLCCLLMISFVFVRGKRMIKSMVDDIFLMKSKQNTFYETTSNDFFNKLLFLILFITVSSVLLFTCISRKEDIVNISVTNTLTCIGCFCLLIAIYLIYKWLIYKIVAYVFFSKLQSALWIESWSYLIFLSGTFLFVFGILLYFVQNLYYFNFYLILLWFFATRIIIIYKSYAIFFKRITDLHYLFLYLCAQEIVPLFLLYKGSILAFEIVLEKGTLWS
ncbi:MAG: DUF4271 domain-containing protein [Dysgonamonadaceae bacterium]|jgi:hypothetical protein|nr:DUF4271 domain-containing protein [Dysgonamonadaceae bacterium]